MEWNAGYAARPAGLPRKRHDEGVPHDPVALLTPEVFAVIKKRRKILPTGAIGRNSTYSLWTLGKSYRFYCTASGRWLIADEVAYDEKMGTFQAVREYQRVVRPRNGQSQEVNFWPQLGVGETRYKTLTSAPRAAYNNPAAAFVYYDDSKPKAQPIPQPQAMPPPPQPGSMPPPPVIPTRPAVPMHPDELQTVMQTLPQATYGRHLDTATTQDGASLFESSTHDGGSAFDPLDDKTSLFGGEGTEAGSHIDVDEIRERERLQEERVAKVMQVASVQRHQALSALNDYDTLDTIPRKGTKEYSLWMTEFNTKHGFKPDILLKSFPRK